MSNRRTARCRTGGNDGLVLEQLAALASGRRGLGADRLVQAAALPVAARRPVGPGDPRFSHPALSDPGATGCADHAVGGVAKASRRSRADDACHRRGVPALCGLRHSHGHADRRIAHRRELHLSPARLLAVDPQDRHRAAVRGVVRLRHAAEGPLCVPARLLSRGGVGGARVQVGRAGHARPGTRHGGEPPADFPHGQPAACAARDLLRPQGFHHARRGGRGGGRVRWFQFGPWLRPAAVDRQLRAADHVRRAGGTLTDRCDPVLGPRRDRTLRHSLACEPAAGLHRGSVKKREENMLRGLITVAAIVLAGPASAADKVTLMLNWYVYGEHAPFYYGKEKGIYAAEGIDLDIQEGRGSGVTAQAVAAKTATFGYVDVPTMMRASVKGAPVIAVGVALQTSPMSAMGFVEKNIRKAEDLKGKTVATTPGDSMSQIWPLFLKKAGLKESDMKIGRAHV